MPLIAAALDTAPASAVPERAVTAAPIAPRLYRAIRLRHVLALALALRLVSLAIPTLAHPDELFQYLEPAHRLVFGQGVVTWEWRDGIRGWLIPLTVAGPMRLGAWIAPGSALYLTLPKLAMTAASLIIVAVAWRLGARLSRLHAVFCASVAAVWSEFVYFAPHILGETIATALVLPAAVLLAAPARNGDRRLTAAGALLGLAVTARFQMAPAIATLVVASCGMRVRDRWRPVLIGGVAGLIPGALADGAMGATPFGWIVANIRLNLVAQRSLLYGTSGPFGFATELYGHWGLWLVPILFLAGIGARRYPALAWTAIVNLAFHSAIAHKEYRFILLSVTIAILLAAIGSVDRARAVARASGAAAGRSRLRVLALAWLAASASLAFGASRSQWTDYRPELTLFARLRDDPALCGLALYRHAFWRGGGYAMLHRAVAIQLMPDERGPGARVLLRREARLFNMVMTAPAHAGDLPGGYTPSACESGASVCLYRRPGSCAYDPLAPTEIDAMLRRLDS